MRESTLDITKYLRQGLRQESMIPTNRFGLEVAVNTVVSGIGLESHEPIIDPFGGALVDIYPHPQIFRGQNGTFLFGQTSVSTVTEGTDPWTVTPIVTVGIDGIAKAITGNGVWHFADMGGTWFAFNGTSVVFQVGQDDLQGLAKKTIVQNAVDINTGCAHQGRVLTGGFNSANFWNATWQGIFTTWRGDEPAGVNPVTSDIDSSYICWSSIGSVEFPLWLFYPELYTYGLGPSAAEAVRKTELSMFGFMPMPFQGPIYAILPLGANVVVYGADGMAILAPYSNEFSSGYGVAISKRVGTYGRNSVIGGEEFHMFLDTRGDAWRVSREGITRIGFSECLASQLTASLRMARDAVKDRIFISGSTGYVLSPQGLTSTTQRVPSVDLAEGALLGVGDDSILEDADYIYITTNPFDMGDRSIKTFTGVTVGVNSTYDIDLSVSYRYKSGDAWREHRWVRANYEGYAYIRVSAVEFKVRIRIKGKTDVQITHASIKWQGADKRTSRGFVQAPTFNE